MEETQDPDRVIFPDDPVKVTSHDLPPSTKEVKSVLPLVVAIVITVLVVAGCLVSVAVWYRRRRKKRKEEEGKEEVDGKFSVKTLGSHYEVESLLSINTADNKSGITLEAVNGVNDAKNGDDYNFNVTKYIDSDVSGSQDMMQQEELEVRGNVNMKSDDLKQANSTNVKHDDLKPAASTYIETSSHSSSKTITPSHSRRSSMITMGEIVTLTEDYLSNHNQSLAPLAQEENSESRPASSFIKDGSHFPKDGSHVRLRSDKVADSSKTLTSSSSNLPLTSLLPQSISVSVQPPSPSLERPVSECLDKAPALPMKKKMEGSTSEQNVNERLAVSSGRGDSKVNNVNMTKSESNLISSLPGIPALPPKAKPLLPPKQAINKSREDVEKITKDMMRASSNVIPERKVTTPNSNLKGSPEIQVDEDYDFPAENKMDGEDEDYDDPSHSFNKTWEYEDYDDPAHTFN